MKNKKIEYHLPHRVGEGGSIDCIIVSNCSQDYREKFLPESSILDSIICQNLELGAIFTHERDEDGSSDCFAVLNDPSEHPEHFLSGKFFFQLENSQNTKNAGAGFPPREGDGA